MVPDMPKFPKGILWICIMHAYSAEQISYSFMKSRTLCRTCVGYLYPLYNADINIVVADKFYAVCNVELSKLLTFAV